MIDYGKFGSLLTQYLSVKSVPSVAFRKDVSLSSPTAALVAQSNIPDDADLSNPEVLQALMKELAAANADMAANGPIFTEFQKVADEFAKKINQGMVKLHEIKGVVEKLTADIAALKTHLMAADPQVATLKQIKSDDVGFSAIDWKPLDLVGSERAVIIQLHGQLNMEEEQPMSEQIVGLLLARLNLNQEGFKVDSVVLSDDQKAAFTAKLKEAGQDDISVYDVIWHLFSANTRHFQHYAADLKRVFENGEASSVNYLVHDAGNIARAIGILVDMDYFGIAESDRAILEKNCALWKQLVLISAYVAIYYRRMLWKNAILVGNTWYNPDNWDVFVGNGGDLQKLAIYYRYYHEDTDIKIPRSGVSTDYVLENVAKAELEINAKAAELTASTDAKTKAMTRQAFIAVTSKFVQDQDATLYATGYTQKDHSSYVASVYDSSKPNTPIEDLLYRVYFSTMQVPHITYRLYHDLGVAYMRQLGSSEEFTAETGDIVDLSVFASFITSFFVEHLLMVSKCND